MKRVKHLLRKLGNRSKMVVGEFFHYYKAFSFGYAWICFLWWMSFYLRLFGLNRSLTKRKQKWIDRYIEKVYPEIVERYCNMPESEILVSDFYIWVFWGQGASNMPPIVRLCYKQLCSNNLQLRQRVKLLDLQNVLKYVDIPKFVFDKLKQGKLLYAHFSDILRNALLAKYGGMWIDATCWTAHPLPDMAYENAFFSPHNEADGTHWCTYAMGGNRIGSVTFSFVRDMLIAVCEREELFPDYLFQDRLLDYAHRKIAASKQSMDATPTNSTRRFMLYPKMNHPFDRNFYSDLISTDWIFKLSYKSFYQKVCDGKETFYSKMMDGSINGDLSAGK